MKAALAVGTVLNLVVAGLWAMSAAATMGPAPQMHLSVHHLAASYLALISGPTGNPIGLFAVVAFIYAACFFLAGLRGLRREARR